MPPAGPDALSGELIEGLTAPLPKTIWIELTSKCPFACIFCSREFERGNGQHMNFDLFRSLIGELKQPEVIRLNYSGESLHYPHLGEAVRLARATGATTELVSALGSASESAVKSLVDNGLHRLSVSIHSMDSAQFRRIYGFGDISGIRERLEYLQACKAGQASPYPEVDFAFVAMRENLSQLHGVAAYAVAMGVKQLSIHPVIRRSAIPVSFPNELQADGTLRSDFDQAIRAEVGVVEARYPGLAMAIARPEVSALTSQGGITTCEQNPWDTVHVLADGSVVVCEVQDRVTIGNLNAQTMAEIWTGAAYRDFRQRYLDGSHPVCSGCPWRRTVAVSPSQQALVRGWHPSSGDTVQWSEASAAMAVAVQPGVTGIRLAGILPPPPAGASANALAIRHGSHLFADIVNQTEEALSFEAFVPALRRADSQPALLRFETKHRFRPAERGQGPDLRNLGFALTELTFRYDSTRQKKARRLLRALEYIDRLPPLHLPIHHAPRGLGLSIVIPARDTPELLTESIAAAHVALAAVTEVSEIIVVVSGAETGACAELRKAFPYARWMLRREVLSFGRAVELGLSRAVHPWVYLLNSDVTLHPSALTEALKLRSPGVFAVGSRIHMRDGSATETNWTDLRYPENGPAELIEKDPSGLQEARGCLYAGGGSALFQTSLLRRFIRRTRTYHPFYWEDVEWGARAWRGGYQCVFCPSSQVTHGHRQTISRYYTADAISRIFERNRLLFHLRNLSPVACLEESLVTLDPESWNYLFHPRVLLSTARARASASMAPVPEAALHGRWSMRY